jgi:aspartate racemase
LGSPPRRRTPPPSPKRRSRLAENEELGVIGGIGPESTIEYYRLIVTGYRERAGRESYPQVIINSIDVLKMLDFVDRSDFRGLTSYLVEGVKRLGAAGADLGLLAANTPHVVFDDVQRESPIPLISIVEATCRAVLNRGLRRVGLFGTRFTMDGRFYPDVFLPAGITLVFPSAAERAYIHEKYVGELVNGIFLPETRQGLEGIVRRLAMEEGIEGLILGGTELPLILREPEVHGVALLDTPKLHVEEAVRRLVAKW